MLILHSRFHLVVNEDLFLFIQKNGSLFKNINILIEKNEDLLMHQLHSQNWILSWNKKLDHKKKQIRECDHESNRVQRV